MLIKQLILNIISVKASRLNDNERKLYAEKVTLAFWRAVGGDNEEIEGLDESEETVNWTLFESFIYVIIVLSQQSFNYNFVSIYILNIVYYISIENISINH